MQAGLSCAKGRGAVRCGRDGRPAALGSDIRVASIHGRTQPRWNGRRPRRLALYDAARSIDGFGPGGADLCCTAALAAQIVVPGLREECPGERG